MQLNLSRRASRLFGTDSTLKQRETQGEDGRSLWQNRGFQAMNVSRNSIYL